jgi:hypothetical protein
MNVLDPEYADIRMRNHYADDDTTFTMNVFLFANNAVAILQRPTDQKTFFMSLDEAESLVNQDLIIGFQVVKTTAAGKKLVERVMTNHKSGNTTTIDNCTLEIDHDRGVIYVHSPDTAITLLRICRLPKPIPHDIEFMDITMGYGANWKGE